MATDSYHTFLDVVDIQGLLIHTWLICFYFTTQNVEAWMMFITSLQ